MLTQIAITFDAKHPVIIVYLHSNHKDCFIAVRGDITQTPKNVATKVRQSVTLHCAGDDIIEWAVLINPHNIIQLITYKKKVLDKYKDRFSLNTDGGQFTLIIKFPVLSDGKTYRCFDIATTLEQRGEAEVIVFGKTYFPIFTDQSLTFLIGKYSNCFFFFIKSYLIQYIKECMT